MESVLVSVIVPIYNVELYLDRCIESLTAQTYDNLEIILINDGSTDESLKHCLNWRIKDNRIIVVDKVNEGQGPARNLGCKIANGKYISFVDSDDWLEASFIEHMLFKICQEDAQVVFCDYHKVFADGSREHIYLESYLTHAIRPEDEPSIIYDAGICYWNKLFKKELLEQVHIDQPPHSSEDSCTLFIILAHAKKIVQLREALYNYFVRENSSSFNIDFAKYYGISLNSARENFMSYKMDDKFWYYVGKIFYSSLIFNRRLKNKDSEFQKNLLNMEKQFNNMFMEKKNPGSMDYLVFGSFNLRSIVNRIAFKPFPYFGFSSLISMMSYDLTEEYQVINENHLREDAVKKDILSMGNKVLQEDFHSVDYIFIDFLEERFDIIEIAQGCYITKSDAWEETTIAGCSPEESYKIIPSGSQEFLDLWHKACIKMITLLKQKFHPSQIILVKTRLAACYGTYNHKEEYKTSEEINIINNMIQQLEELFISEYPGIQILDLDDKELLYTDYHYEYGRFPWHMNHYAYAEMANSACRLLKY